MYLNQGTRRQIKQSQIQSWNKRAKGRIIKLNSLLISHLKNMEITTRLCLYLRVVFFLFSPLMFFDLIFVCSFIKMGQQCNTQFIWNDLNVFKYVVIRFFQNCCCSLHVWRIEGEDLETRWSRGGVSRRWVYKRA